MIPQCAAACCDPNSAPYMTHCKTSAVLWLHSSRLTEPLKWAIARNIKLGKFTFEGNVYWDESFKHTEVVHTFLKQSGPYIKHLAIVECDRPMGGVMELVTNACPNLDALIVADCALPIEIPQMLMCKGNHIRDLYLEAQFDKPHILVKSYFANVNNHTVERFRLAATLEVGCLQEVGRAFPNLQEIHLKVNFTTPDKCHEYQRYSMDTCDGSQCWLDLIAVCNPRLRTIGLCECGSLTVDNFKLMLNTWKHLTALEIINCEHLHGSALYLIPTYCAHTLECFTFCGKNRPNEHLAPALVRCKALRTLHIYCSTLRRHALTKLLTELPTLRVLDLQYTSPGEFKCTTLSVLARLGKHLDSCNYCHTMGGLNVRHPFGGWWHWYTI